MKTVYALALVCICHPLFVNNAFAQRKGFILEIGLGPGYTSYQETVTFGQESFSAPRERRRSLMTDFKIGYAPSDVLMIYWTSNVSWFTPKGVTGPEAIVAHGVAGLGARYFLSPSSPSLYVNGAIGYSSWFNPFSFNSSGGSARSEKLFGAGAVVGGGYEFAKHIVAQVDILLGRPAMNESGAKHYMSNRSLKLTMNFVLY